MPDYKPKVFRVRLSESFMARAKCKYCLGSPILYYYVRNPTLWNDPRMAQKDDAYLRKLIKEFKRQGFLTNSVGFISVSNSSRRVLGQHFRPKLHRTRGTNPIYDIVQYVTCDCMRTSWAYSDQAISLRKEIANRKARHTFPSKFEF